jgi:NADPH:quinone reductase-like Zn-dependent oxidoreductase
LKRSSTTTELVSSIGADHVIDYTTEQIPAGRYDVILDIAGNRKLSHLRKMLTAKGMLVIVGGEDGGRWLGMNRMIGAILLSPFVTHRLRGVIAGERKKDIEFLRKLVEDGKITPVISRTCGLPEVADAIKDLQAGGARGKVVVTV